MAPLSVPLRSAAVSLALSGLIVAMVLPLHPSILSRPVGEVVADTPLWTMIHAAGVLVFPLALLGSLAIVAVHHRMIGRSGSIGIALTFVGAFGGMALFALEAIAFPVLAQQAPHLLSLDGPIMASWQVRFLAGMTFGWPLGLALVGLGAARAGAFPRAAGVLLAVSGPAFLLLYGLFVPIAGLLASLLFGGVQVWWAALLWRTAVRTGRG